MDATVTYLLRILPALALFAIVLVTLQPTAKFRIVLYVALFILLRDALTPLGLWSLGSHRGAFWLRLTPDPLFLMLFALGAVLLVLVMWYADRENRRWVTWFHGSPGPGLLLGLFGGLVATAPLAIAYRFIDLADRGGAVALPVLLAGFVFAMAGNLYEEFLFRGYVLGLLAERRPLAAAGWLSGLLFALCHVFLAVTVTDVGAPLLLFVLWEGLVAGFVGARRGVIPAALAHGGTVFLLSSGLL